MEKIQLGNPDANQDFADIKEVEVAYARAMEKVHRERVAYETVVGRLKSIVRGCWDADFVYDGSTYPDGWGRGYSYELTVYEPQFDYGQGTAKMFVESRDDEFEVTVPLEWGRYSLEAQQELIQKLAQEQRDKVAEERAAKLKKVAQKKEAAELEQLAALLKKYPNFVTETDNE